VKHRIASAAIALLLATAVSTTAVTPALGYNTLTGGGTGHSSWITYNGGTYSKWIAFCMDAAHSVPGGSGGQMWVAIQTAFGAVNTWVNAHEPNTLHYSFTGVTCDDYNFAPGQPYVRVYYWANQCSDASWLACAVPSVNTNGQVFYGQWFINGGWATCGTNACGSWWTSLSNWPLIGYNDLYTTALHETLHNTGLAHTQSSHCPGGQTGHASPNAVMCATIGTGERSFISAGNDGDDAVGIDYLY